IEDLVLSDALTGIPANWLVPSLKQAGYDTDNMVKGNAINFDNPHADTKAWRDTWSAGQGVGSVKAVQPLAEVVAQLRREYVAALEHEKENAWGSGHVDAF
ncbi:MAG: hypothetical protein KDJ52_36485, partial [Anaerolineae bacterium]|nr:hypothetical protein [Anaerolineae bacterium]